MSCIFCVFIALTSVCILAASSSPVTFQKPTLILSFAAYCMSCCCLLCGVGSVTCVLNHYVLDCFCFGCGCGCGGRLLWLGVAVLVSSCCCCYWLCLLSWLCLRSVGLKCLFMNFELLRCLIKWESCLSALTSKLVVLPHEGSRWLSERVLWGPRLP
jgi:hypothetical protein